MRSPASSDYVVVGAGSAGCALAARLSEDPAVTVTLVEAGRRDRARNIGIPAAFGQLFRTVDDWDYLTAPEPGCDGREMYWPRGKVLGGSSSINAMIYIRGNRVDYDGWRDDAGCDGWGYDGVLPYFLRSEGNSRGGSTYHNADGPLTVSEQRSPSPMTEAFVEAATQAGMVRNPDFNGVSQDGAGLYQATQRGGARCSAARAFLRPARRRKNLTVLTGALAARVMLTRGRASGVEVVVGNRRELLPAGREVILCGGAVNTPQLLLLSGIGPAAQLADHGIATMVDAPGVGANLSDHVSCAVSWHCPDPVSLFEADKRLGNLANYLARRRGPFTSIVAEGGGFLRTDPGLPAPDIQLLFAPALFLDHGLTDPPGHGITLGPYLLTPASRGTVTLRSADPTAKPVIHANYYAERSDLDRMRTGLRACLDIGSRRPLAPYRAERFLPAPGDDSDAALDAHLRARSETIYHPVGTAAMGSGPDSVCDPQLRVRGVDGLRVADASVMPTVPRGNTNAPTIMVAEKAADLLLGRSVHARAAAVSV